MSNDYILYKFRSRYYHLNGQKSRQSKPGTSNYTTRIHIRTNPNITEEPFNRGNNSLYGEIMTIETCKPSDFTELCNYQNLFDFEVERKARDVSCHQRLERQNGENHTLETGRLLDSGLTQSWVHKTGYFRLTFSSNGVEEPT